ncbi:MAG: S9 family peptidase [Bacteroidaceae bacterium]|nr:S9 family peptidase [Bacteroidaceae bacterium]
MKRILIIFSAIAVMSACKQQEDKTIITRSDIKLESDVMTPEALWAMGHIGSYAVSPDQKHLAYQVSYYSVEQNRSHTVLYLQDIAEGAEPHLLTTHSESESDPVWLADNELAFASEGEVWTMNIRGRVLKAKGRQQLTKTNGEVEGFLFSPDQKKIILIKQVPFHDIIAERPADLPKSTGRVVNDLMYRHWDHYVESIPHPFVLDLETGEEHDILEGQPYECPMEPFGGIEQLAWSPDSKFIAFTCRTKTGLDYSISTDSDIFLYNVESGNLDDTKNLCKGGIEFGVVPDEGLAYHTDNMLNPTKTLKEQAINKKSIDYNVGYDQNPKFSPDGKYVAWTSMERDGYEADRQRLCVYDLQNGTKQYITETFDSNVDDFVWASDSKTIYFLGVWHATENLYRTNLNGEVTQLSNYQADFGSLQLIDDTHLLLERHDYMHPADLYLCSVDGDAVADIQQITHENDHILSQIAAGTSEARWIKTTTGEDMHYWIVKPPHFDPNKKYPTLLFCEGGPQSPVSQFWSYRWNFMIMAAQGYVIIAPNRHGLPGFGLAWQEEISGDWTGQCMQDYLAAIDDAAENLPYVDRDRLAAVGASFGGFSVYYLAGHHDKRFKCFIAHDGAFNLEAMYTETEENWFSNWEYDDAYWNKDQTARAHKTYENSPHRFVDQWDTPILCIHGEKDYRINATQGMSAFNAARMRGIEAQLLIFPDENHWVLKPQNGILWQRTYFQWLSRWLGV